MTTPHLHTLTHPPLEADLLAPRRHHPQLLELGREEARRREELERGRVDARLGEGAREEVGGGRLEDGEVQARRREVLGLRQRGKESAKRRGEGARAQAAGEREREGPTHQLELRLGLDPTLLALGLQRLLLGIDGVDDGGGGARRRADRVVVVVGEWACGQGQIVNSVRAAG